MTHMKNTVAYIAALQVTFYTLEPIYGLFEQRPDPRLNTGGNYFWSDPASPQGHGPFRTLLQATEHYNFITKPPPPLDLTPVADIIRVDFKAKRKVIPFTRELK
jgi:hypothetical protein